MLLRLICSLYLDFYNVSTEHFQTCMWLLSHFCCKALNRKWASSREFQNEADHKINSSMADNNGVNNSALFTVLNYRHSALKASPKRVGALHSNRQCGAASDNTSSSGAYLTERVHIP